MTTKCCPKCGGPMRMQVQAVISAPSELAHLLSKSNLRRKDVYLMGVMWETADHICENPECQYIFDGYGNYVTGLAKRVEELEKVLQLAEETLSGWTPFTTQLSANGQHPSEVIEAIRAVIYPKQNENM